MNVDVDQVKLDVFGPVRPQDENVCCAIGNGPGEATLYSFGHDSMLSTLAPQKAAEYRGLGYECVERPVRVRTRTGELGYELINWTGLTAFFIDARAT